MKMTLLAMVQDILNDMSDDEVSSISDTIRSLQIAQIIKTTYYDLVAELGITGHSEYFKLTAFGDTSNPTKLQIPDDVSEIFFLRYNVKQGASLSDDYTDVTYLSPIDFVDYVNGRDSTASNIETVTGAGSDLYIRNDRSPKYWTSFDDSIIYMDAYDSDLESSLQQSKTQAYGIKEPTWSAIDTFTPDLPANLFPMFLAEAKLSCMAKLKSTGDPIEANKVRRHRIRMQTTKRRIKDSRYIEGPDYGRK